MNDLRLGFIGYGRHAKANLYPSLKVLGVPILAVATTHEESALEASEDYSIPNYYSDHNEMLQNENLDCVFICAQPPQQSQLVKDALNAGNHVFVEKNLGDNEEEAKEIDDIALEQGKFVMVGFMKRFAPIYKKMYEVTNNKDFGDILSLSQTFTSRNFVDNGEEYLLFAAIHFIDILRFYLGEITEVKGFESVLGDSISFSFAVKSEKGATGSLYYSASPSWVNSAQEITITGSNGYARAYGIDEFKYHPNKKEKSEIPGWQTINEQEIDFKSMLTTGGGGSQNLYLNGFVGEIEYFLEAVKKGKLAINTSAENVKTMRLYDLLVASLKK